MATRDPATGSAAVQGELWGARARDSAEVQEPAQRELYRPVFDAASVGEGTSLLDAGCGSGVAAAIAHARGAKVSGIDAALPGGGNRARARPGGATLASASSRRLPYDDDSFDVVTGFNAFQYAADRVHALQEARRMVRRGGTVAILTWGQPERCRGRRNHQGNGLAAAAASPEHPGRTRCPLRGGSRTLAQRAGLTRAAPPSSARAGSTRTVKPRYEDTWRPGRPRRR